MKIYYEFLFVISENKLKLFSNKVYSTFFDISQNIIVLYFYSKIKNKCLKNVKKTILFPLLDQ